MLSLSAVLDRQLMIMNISKSAFAAYHFLNIVSYK